MTEEDAEIRDALIGGTPLLVAVPNLCGRGAAGLREERGWLWKQHDRAVRTARSSTAPPCLVRCLVPIMLDGRGVIPRRRRAGDGSRITGPVLGGDRRERRLRAFPIRGRCRLNHCGASKDQSHEHYERVPHCILLLSQRVYILRTLIHRGTPGGLGHTRLRTWQRPGAVLATEMISVAGG